MEPTNTKALEPIDPTRCQAEIKEGSFMTFGLRKYVRCQNKPTYVAIDFRDGTFYGAMSLCDSCKEVCRTQWPSVSFQQLCPVNRD